MDAPTGFLAKPALGSHVHRLILRGGCNLSVRSEVRQRALNLPLSVGEIIAAFHAMKAHIAPYPAEATSLGMNRVMAAAGWREPGRAVSVLKGLVVRLARLFEID
jgi:hypothetical protein